MYVSEAVLVQQPSVPFGMPPAQKLGGLPLAESVPQLLRRRQEVEIRDGLVAERAAGVTAREASCQKQEGDLHKAWAEVFGLRKKVETARAEAGSYVRTYVRT